MQAPEHEADVTALEKVFLLALDGLFADRPAPGVLERRTRLLVARFASYDPSKEGAST